MPIYTVQIAAPRPLTADEREQVAQAALDVVCAATGYDRTKATVAPLDAPAPPRHERTAA